MSPAHVRLPAVAGSFYPASAEAIKKQISSFVTGTTKKTDCIAALLPHAGYTYSGKVAAETVSQIKIRETVVLLGPNHTGFGTPFSIMPEGSWKTPLGTVEIDSGLARLLMDHSGHLREDSLAHLHEHSIEVELPILQYFKTAFKIIPIAVASDNLKTLQEVGVSIARAIADNGYQDKITLIASSDMTHYES